MSSYDQGRDRRSCRRLAQWTFALDVIRVFLDPIIETIVLAIGGFAIGLIVIGVLRTAFRRGDHW